MDLKNELINGRGYSIFSVKNIHILENLRNNFIKRIYNSVFLTQENCLLKCQRQKSINQ